MKLHRFFIGFKPEIHDRKAVDGGRRVFKILSAEPTLLQKPSPDAPTFKSGREFIKENPLREFIYDKNLISQVKNVLRLKEKDKIILLDNSGKEYLSEVGRISSNQIQIKVLESSENKNEPKLFIRLYQAIPKRQKFEWLLEKNTELGVAEFQPIITQRTEKINLNFPRLEKIIKEAAEQSERGILPKIFPPKSFSSALEDKLPIIILDPRGKSLETKIADIKSILETQRQIGIFVGPEGGFTEEEIALAKSTLRQAPLDFVRSKQDKFPQSSSGLIINLGPRILKSETAGLVFNSILYFLSGDL